MITRALLPLTVVALTTASACCTPHTATTADPPAAAPIATTSPPPAPAAPAPQPQLPVAAVDDTPSAVFDRVLLKLKDPHDLDTLAARVEQLTGAKVQAARKSVASYALVTFAPTTPPRDAAAQKVLVDALVASGAFGAVEGDHMMKAQ